MTSNSKFASITQYLNWIIKQYHELQQQAQQRDAYRLVNIEQNNNGNCKLTVQIVGKNITFKVSPEEIAADDNMLSHFSRQDVRTITYFACEEIRKPKYKILIQEFCDKLNKIIFHVHKHGSGKIEKKTAAEISIDKEMIKKMDPKDAHMVGYTSALDKEAIKITKDNSEKNDERQ